MSIYTCRGDHGETDLRDMTRVPKTNPRIEAYGTVDELNALIGTIRPTGYTDLDDELRTVQNHLHVIQAEFATPDLAADDPRIRPESIDRIEDWIDRHAETIEPLTKFILPGGSDAGARLHHARAVSRRAERRAVGLQTAESLDTNAIQYLNRLSDYLFVVARVANARDGATEENPEY